MIINICSLIPALFSIFMVVLGISYVNVTKTPKLRVKLFENDDYTEDEHKMAYRALGVRLIGGAALILPSAVLFNGVVKFFVTFIVLAASIGIGVSVGDAKVKSGREAKEDTAE